MEPNDNDPNQLFRVGANFSYPAGENSNLIANFGRTRQDLFPDLLAALLSKCVGFKTLKQHIQETWSKIPPLKKFANLKTILDAYSQRFDSIIVSPNGFERMLVEIFGDLAKNDFLVSWDTFSQWTRQNTPADSRSPIASIGLITRNRLESLRNSLESYIENSRKWEQTNDFLVFDDSPAESTRQDYRLALKTLSQKFNVPISYAGYEEKRKFADALIQTGLPAEMVDFSLFDVHKFGMTYGINRNAFLLHSAGDKVFSADDDTFCRVARSPIFKEGLQIGFPELPYESWFYSDRASALNSVSYVDQDLLALHESTLGKTIGQCVSQGYDASSLVVESMNPELTRFIQKGEGKILVTLNGLVGDTGSNSPIPALFSSGKQRERLLESESTYRKGLKSRESCKANDHLKIGRAGPLMTTFLGMDNRDILPPFFPVFRMEDAIFGDMLQKCQPDSCFAYIPWVLVHAPNEVREEVPDQFDSGDPFWPNDALATALQTFHSGFSKEDMAQKLRRVGEHIINFGSMPFAEYKEMVTEYRRIQSAQIITTYEKFLKKYPKSPAYWTKDVNKLITSAQKNALCTSPLAPEELIEKFGVEESEKLIQKMVHQFGELVKGWPDIVQATKDLRKKGIRLAQPV